MSSEPERGVMYEIPRDVYRYFLRRAQRYGWKLNSGKAYARKVELYQKFIAGLKAEGSIYDQ